MAKNSGSQNFKSAKIVSNSFFQKGSVKRKETIYGPKKGSKPAGRISNPKGV